MSNVVDKNDDFLEEDWESVMDFEERELEKRRSNNIKHKRKASTKQRLDDYFEQRELRKRNRFLDDEF